MIWIKQGEKCICLSKEVPARLEKQKLLLKDPNYTRTVRIWVRKDGERGRKAAVSAVVVATTPQLRLCVVFSERAEANRV